jgi:hypothetical protein
VATVVSPGAAIAGGTCADVCPARSDATPSESTNHGMFKEMLIDFPSFRPCRV